MYVVERSVTTSAAMFTFEVINIIEVAFAKSNAYLKLLFISKSLPVHCGVFHIIGVVIIQYIFTPREYLQLLPGMDLVVV